MVSRWRLLLAAAVLHVAVVLTIYSAGRLQLLPDTFDVNGIGVSFAIDSRSYRIEATEMSDLLHQARFSDWISYNSQFHVKLYSLSFALLGPVFGFNILSAEPLNLAYYLSILTLVYAVGRKAFDSEVGLIAAGIVSVWPSLLLHTTQMLRDPLFIAALLLLVLILLAGVTSSFSWAQAFLAAAAGTGACVLLWRSRGDMWELVFAIVLIGIGMIVAYQFKKRQILLGNILFSTLLFSSVLLIPRIVPTYRQPDHSLVLAPHVAGNYRAAAPAQAATLAPAGSVKQIDSPSWTRLADRIGLLRHKFIISYPLAGSNIDATVELKGIRDIIGYFPRAILIGFFSPFPNMWFARGEQVGVVGRLVSGAETLMMYAIVALALLSLVMNRRRLPVWLIVLIAAIGCTALGYVVVNISTLYRMRYAFWILLIVLAASTIQCIRESRVLSLRSEKHTENLPSVV